MPLIHFEVVCGASAAKNKAIVRHFSSIFPHLPGHPAISHVLTALVLAQGGTKLATKVRAQRQPAHGAGRWGRHAYLDFPLAPPFLRSNNFILMRIMRQVKVFEDDSGLTQEVGENELQGFLDEVFL